MLKFLVWFPIFLTDAPPRLVCILLEVDENRELLIFDPYTRNYSKRSLCFDDLVRSISVSLFFFSFSSLSQAWSAA
ncbi:hypothetical protein FB451DRAFT_1205968 [Mycena latifolia]|nr:hypothetical protein FB451DRAFT_1205968 [Mycena latifolia]